MTDTRRIPAVSRRTLWILLSVIALGVAGRLYRIQEPVYGYRPSDTAAIARNFSEGGMRLLYPQIDWRGQSTGYVESEFPAYTYTIALLYRAFGEKDVIGKLLSLLSYVLSSLVLFALVRRLYDDRAGLLSVLFYTMATVAYSFTRAVQPDAWLALGSLAGLYYFWIWTETRSIGALVLSMAGVCLAVLIKPICLYLGLPLMYLAYRAFGTGFLRRTELWVFAAAVTVPMVLWYRHAYGFWLVDGNTFGVFGGWVKYRAFPPDLGQTAAALKETMVRLWLLIATPIGCALLVAGIVRRPPNKNYFLHVWALGFAVATVVAAKGMAAHDYYQLPMVYIVAAFMAYGATMVWDAPRLSLRVRQMTVAVSCLFVVGFSLWRWQIRLTRMSPEEWNRVAFAERVARFSQPTELIVMVRPYRGVTDLYQHRTAQGEYFECDPVDFYHSHRIGWSLDDHQASLAMIDTLRRRGARFVATAYPDILTRHPGLREGLDARYTPVEVNDHWAIYRLDGPRAEESRQ
jgi:Dolichyl-phosphate-mannose-protein mannosyltransferase